MAKTYADAAREEVQAARKAARLPPSIRPLSPPDLQLPVALILLIFLVQGIYLTLVALGG